MKFEKSAGAVIFRESGKDSTREYLLLSHTSLGKEKKIIWDFPKGRVNEGEAEKAAAEREVVEETGLSEFSFLEGFRETLKIFYKYQGEFFNKTVVYFLSQATDAEVRISFEHNGFEWLSFPEALKKLSFKNSRELLTRAEGFLKG